MLQSRIIPCLLLSGGGLVKTVGFKDPKYVGDPINAVRIFNDKEVDELVFLDIDASKKNEGPRFDLIARVASECFMPLCYGGGVRNIEDVQKLFKLGVEKVALRTQAIKQPQLIREISSRYGNQAVVGVIDVKKNLFGKHKVVLPEVDAKVSQDVLMTARAFESEGVGEIFINSVDRDGTQKGYDIELIRSVVQSVQVPVIACGGAGSIEDLSRAIHEGGASAVAAGSLFVFHGRHRAVLINYPNPETVSALIAGPSSGKS